MSLEPDVSGPIPSMVPVTPLPLTRRFPAGETPRGEHPGDTEDLVLSLTSEERSHLRGLRRCRCGREVLLQLTRGEALRPGETLTGDAGRPVVRVEASLEPLIAARSTNALALLQAAYHLGNRHVALEILPGELRLLDDPVLAHLLEHRGLKLTRLSAPFQPEDGAYGGHHHNQP